MRCCQDACLATLSWAGSQIPLEVKYFILQVLYETGMKTHTL